MKKLFGLLIVLIAALIGGYYGLGVYTEQVITDYIERLNQYQVLDVEMDYQRGLLASSAKIKVYRHDDHINPPVDITLNIHNGPIIFANKQLRFGIGYAYSEINLTEKMLMISSGLTQDSVKPKVNLSLFISYLDNRTMESDIPAFNLKSNDKAFHLNWLGFHDYETTNKPLDKIQGKVDFQGLDLESGDEKNNVRQTSLVFNLRQDPTELYYGDMTWKLDSYQRYLKDAEQLTIKGLDFGFDSAIAKNRFNIHFNFSLKSVFANGQTHGPASFKLSFRNLDAEMLAKIKKQSAGLQNATAAERQAAMIMMAPDLPSLINKGTEIEGSNIKVQMPQGLVEGHFLIVFPESESANPVDLAQKIKGDASFKVPMALLKSINPNQVDALEKDGYLKVQGTDYLIEMKLDQGKLMVNGKLFDSSVLKP